jgi:hypothetical protein
MVWQLKRILDKPSLQAASFLGLGIGMSILSPHIQMTYFVLWGLFAMWFVASIQKLIETKNIKSILPQAAGFWGGVAIGMALGAIQFIPAYEYVYNELSVRGADRTIETAASWSLHWAEVFSLWVPELGNWFGWYWGDNPFKLNTEYAGAMITLLAIFAFIKNPKSLWRIFWAIVGVFAVSIALGLHTPIFRIAYAIIPGVKKFRALSMFMFWFSFANTMLAVIFLKDMWDNFWEESKSTKEVWKKRFIIAISVVTALTVIFSLKPFTQGIMSALTPSLSLDSKKMMIFDINFSKEFLPMLWLWWAMAIATIHLIYFTIIGKIKKEWFFVGILVIGSFDILRVDHKFIKMKDLYLAKTQQGGVQPKEYERELYTSDASYRRVNPEIRKLQREMKREPFRVMFLPFLGRPLSQNVAGAFDLEGLGGFHDNELLHYREFRGAGSGNYFAAFQGVTNMQDLQSRLSVGSNLLNVANCKYFILPHESQGYGGRKKREYLIVENRNYLPRLSFSTKFIVVDSSDKALSLLKSNFFSSRDTIILSEQPEGVTSRLFAKEIEKSENDSILDSTAITTIDSFAITDISTKWNRYTANNRVAEVEVKESGILRIAEVDYPGWEIKIDGKTVKPIRADIAWMAVPISAGKHKIEMTINSPFLPKAEKITVPTVIILLIYWFGILILSIKKRVRKK